MCNAWNHSINCKCGWGGDGHLGGYGERGFFRPLSPPNYSSFRRLDSYTQPNARCPVCAQRVFFYQSPNGGRVFFDKLGEGWPKHPCTDSSFSRPSFKLPRTAKTANDRHALVNTSINGTPLIVSRIENHQHADYTKIFVTINDEELVIWSKYYGLQEGAPYFYIKQEEGIYLIESIVISRDGGVSQLIFKAYKNQMDFDLSNLEIFPKKTKHEFNKPVVIKSQKNIPNIKLIEKLKRQVSKPKNINKPIETAMSLAFKSIDMNFSL